MIINVTIWHSSRDAAVCTLANDELFLFLFCRFEILVWDLCKRYGWGKVAENDICLLPLDTPHWICIHEWCMLFSVSGTGRVFINTTVTSYNRNDQTGNLNVYLVLQGSRTEPVSTLSRTVVGKLLWTSEQ